MRLDYLREQQSADPAQMEWGDLPVRWNNSDPGTVKVHLLTLHKLVGLPMYPFFDRDIFNEQPPTSLLQWRKIWRILITPLNNFFVANHSAQSDQILLESVYRCHNRRKHKMNVQKVEH